MHKGDSDAWNRNAPEPPKIKAIRITLTAAVGTHTNAKAKPMSAVTGLYVRLAKGMKIYNRLFS